MLKVYSDLVCFVFLNAVMGLQGTTRKGIRDVIGHYCLDKGVRFLKKLWCCAQVGYSGINVTGGSDVFFWV